MEKIALGAAFLAAALVLLLGLAGRAGAVLPAGENPGYVSRLFDASRVHTLNIQVEDWDAFLESAPEEEYIPATVEIDGETFRQVGLRAKGNNSLRLTEEYGLSRYSLKLEFDHYTDGSYHGLDKLSLDSSFQDNSYLKTWLAFDIMEFLGVATPLRSFVRVTVNGQPWGLFLAVEEPEESFARRNFGADHGQLYKPDYRSLTEENADVHLRYTTDDPMDYPGIFGNAKLDPSGADRQRLVESLKVLNSGEDLETVVDVEQVLRYFVGQVFVMNWDSYLGHTGHNYLLYEEKGMLSMLPWDYNLAFGTYALGMTDPITDPNVLVNYPILTPAPGEHMTKRPLYHQLMQVDAHCDPKSCLIGSSQSTWRAGNCPLSSGKPQSSLPPTSRPTPPPSAPMRITVWRWRPWRKSACSGPKAPGASWRGAIPPPWASRPSALERAWTPPI